MNNRISTTLLVSAVSVAGLCYLAGCGSSSSSGLAMKSSLNDYQSIKDEKLPDLTANQALILREIMDEATLVGGAALEPSTVAKSLGSIRAIVDNDLGALFKPESSSKSESVSLDETRNCSNGGQVHGTGTGKSQIDKASATVATVKADESGSLNISACKTAKDVTLEGALQALGSQSGSLNRKAEVTEYDTRPDSYSIDYRIALQGTLKAAVSGESHSVTFKDFGVAFNYSDAKAQEYSNLPWDPLSGEVYNAYMAFYSNLLFCRGTVQIDGKDFSCGSILKFGVDHQIKS